MLHKIKLPMIAAIAAFVFTVGTTAFTKVSNPPATFMFAYQPTNDFSQSQVEDIANWAIGSPSCSGVNKACEIEVDQADTHVEQNTRVLNDASFQDHVTIAAAPGLTDPTTYRVDGSQSLNILSVANKN
jgi:hypothetical protein